MATYSTGKPESESTKAQMEFAEDIEASRSTSKDNHDTERVSLTEEDVMLYLAPIPICPPNSSGADNWLPIEQEYLPQD